MNIHFRFFILVGILGAAFAFSVQRNVGDISRESNNELFVNNSENC